MLILDIGLGKLISVFSADVEPTHAPNIMNTIEDIIRNVLGKFV
tara:strand:- start:2056 stop:2187 length:132 start_codon:yes stop_codon:yes gene_type:complete